MALYSSLIVTTLCVSGLPHGSVETLIDGWGSHPHSRYDIMCRGPTSWPPWSRGRIAYLLFALDRRFVHRNLDQTYLGYGAGPSRGRAP